MQRITARIESALSHRFAGAVLLAVGAIGYALAYHMHPLLPGHDAGAIARGWWTWTDQSRYLAEATAIAQGRLDATTYHYPVGYPALGALFWRWMPVNPFFVPNLLLVGVAAAVWWRLAVRWLSRLEALLVALLFLATHRWLVATTMVVPWNTIATQALLLAGIWLVVARSGSRVVWMLGALAAAAYAVRPIDAVSFGPLLVLATLRIETWRARLAHGAGAAAMIVAAVLAIGALNLRTFGQWRSPYETISTQTIGFFSYPVSYKFYWLFVDGGPLFKETDPALLWRYPWLAFAIAGAAFWVKREQWAGVAGLAALGLNWLLYVNYNDLLPSDIYRFTLIHYLAWGFPLLFLLVAAALRQARRSIGVKAGFVAAVTVLAVGLGVRLEERPIAVERAAGDSWRLPATRPLLVRFPEAPMERVADLRVDDRPLTEYSQYLAPYVPSNLQLLLGARTAGTRLSVAPGSPLVRGEAQFAEYVWRWGPEPSRLRGWSDSGEFSK